MFVAVTVFYLCLLYRMSDAYFPETVPICICLKNFKTLVLFFFLNLIILSYTFPAFLACSFGRFSGLIIFISINLLAIDSRSTVADA